MNKKKIIIVSVILYLVGTGLGYGIFSRNGIASQNTKQFVPSSAKTTAYKALEFDQTEPKTEACPLNGAMYSKSQRSWWEKHRPLGVMIENSTDARPQSGISFADVTYEALAEGGITRTLNVFYCQDAGIVGPVRSARTYFLDFISEYGAYPLYAHVGGANTPGPADALGQINDYGWAGYNDLNQFAIGFPTYYRDESRLGRDVATEHTMYSTTTSLWGVGQQRGLTNVDKDKKSWDTDFVPYSYKEDAASGDRGVKQAVHIDFWDNNPGYSVDWKYDNVGNKYLRENGGEVHKDRNIDKQLSAKNVIVLFMKENHANDGYTDNEHLLYKDTGTGDAFIFMDGKEIKGTWKKASRTARTLLYDAGGNEVKFDRGKFWFEIVPLYATVTVQ
jgi:hypothetical protein